MDFSGCPLSKRYYSGSERKTGIVYKGEPWILKFQTKDSIGYRFNHVSEHIGSRVFELFGIRSQNTELGTFHGEQVVACRDFVRDGCMFVPFNDVGESALEHDKEQFQYTYEDVMEMLGFNTKLTDVQSTTDAFWNMYIVDALLGNFDRHGSNWGFIKESGRYELAPVFDNGSCLFPQIIDEDMMTQIMGSRELTEERVFKFPTSQIKLNGRKSSYHEVISSMEFEECNRALERMVPRYDIDRISAVIDGVECISEVHKRFYRHMIESRFALMLEPAYERLRP